MLCGAVGVAAMTLVTALLRALAEVPSPAELVGDRLGERVPVKPFLDLIGLIGTYGRLKALSIAGTVALTQEGPEQPHRAQPRQPCR